MSTTITIDTKELERAMDLIETFPNQARRSLSDSLNRTASKIITFASDEVRGEYPSIKRKAVKGIAKVNRSNAQNLDASIEFRDARLRASYFPHTISRRKNRSPVTLKIKKSPAISGGNPIMFGEGTARRRGANGSREVYKRYPDSREVQVVYTVGIPQMITNPVVFDEIQKSAVEFLSKRFMHDLEYRIQKHLGLR